MKLAFGRMIAVLIPYSLLYLDIVTGVSMTSKFLSVEDCKSLLKLILILWLLLPVATVRFPADKIGSNMLRHTT